MAALALGLGLSGCGSMVQVQQSCTSRHAAYLQAWDCIRAEVAANRAGAMNNDLGVRHMAYGDALAEQVRLGQLTDAQAKAFLADELVRNNSAFEARKPRSISCTTNRFGSLLLTDCL